MSQCRKFVPNIFHKSKCSNCFRQKEEHTAEALECNRASRSVARSGYLFVAPDWDFSVPLNRTKRWQRRWFVLYDDGELNYSVDEHPDTIPQGSVDMSKVLEVTGAEQVTGHPHSLALTSPDRVTFVKAASREDARWWAELLAVFPRRHKRNATFPGGRASPSLPQLGRSASPQPPRPRHLSVTGPSPRVNFETPPLKEEKETKNNERNKDSKLGGWTTGVIEHTPPLIRKDYLVSSGSPPTRDKLRCDDKARVRRDWRNERLRDIATALTDRSPESSLALPAEGLLHLKKGWLWLKLAENEWARRWTVLCGPTLNVYSNQDEHGVPEVSVELSTVTAFAETPTDSKYGFQIQWAGPTLCLSAVTQGIRSNWMQALKMAAPMAAADNPATPTTPKSIMMCSSDDEYRTASEGGRRESGDWSELPPSPPLNRLAWRTRQRPRLPRSQSRQSTLDSTSTDELDGATNSSAQEIAKLEQEISRLKQLQSEATSREQTYKELLASLEERHAEWQKKKKNGGHDVDVDRLNVNELRDLCVELRCRFDKAVKEVRSLQLTLRRTEEDLDRAELTNHSLKAGLELRERHHQDEVNLLVSRLDYLTSKLNEKARRRPSMEETEEERRQAKRRLRRFRRKSLDSCLGSDLREEEVVRKSVSGVVAQLQQLLLEKLAQPVTSDGKNKMAAIADKMAFEKVLIGRIQQALEGPSSRLAEKEARETGHLILALERKLLGLDSAVATASSKTSAAYLTHTLTQYFLSKQGCQTLRPITLQPNCPTLKSLQEQQRRIQEMYDNFLANNLATVDGLDELTSQIARSEVVDSELSHALLRAARTYQTNQDVHFAFYASERASLELWSDSVDQRLRLEIDKAVTALKRRGNTAQPIELQRFADVVAHKALIDARIDVLSGQFKSDLPQDDWSVRSWFNGQRCLEELRDEPGLVSAELEAEFRCMFDQSLHSHTFREVLACAEELQTKLDEFRRVTDSDDADLVLIRTWSDVCHKCQTLQASLDELRRLIASNGGSFPRSNSHTDQRTHSGTEYLNQMEQLRAAYRCALASCKERYQEADIEQLQRLCEQVLTATDQWHRRTIREMREAHAQEVATLQQEKEQALAEETQATLAALDAMRKAHVAEVQREVARFKQEYARQQRNDVADLSERLSVKTMEAQALEQQLSSATRQLAHAQQRILQLERNPQLSSVQN